MTTPALDAAAGPLAGLRVLEIGHFVAAPFCARLLADLGADVIKIEPPGKGDPVRGWGGSIDDKSLWWSVHGRNKRCVTLDLKHARARDIVLGLVRRCDAVVENFRPGQLARLGFSDDALRAVNPGLMVVHISGFGQDGPYRDRAAFGVIGEAMGGIRHLTAYPPGMTDLPPVRTGVSLGDSVTAIYAAFGLMAALWRRARDGGGPGRSIDAALTESVFSLLEGCLPEYGALGVVRQPTGSTLPTNAPSNAYRTRDGAWLLIAANSDPLFAKLAALMDMPGLAGQPRFRDNPARCANAAALDALIGGWVGGRDAADLEAALAAADIPASRVFTTADCAVDPQFRARGFVRAVDDPAFGRAILHPGIVPRFDGPDGGGAIRWPGPAVGAHNEEVYRGLLGLDAPAFEALRREKAI
ncbi:MAG: CoA transferase [Rhodospirillales bacterium]|nr:MAG: CoA transferase [Rhodospirillales bacterium]